MQSQPPNQQDPNLLNVAQIPNTTTTSTTNSSSIANSNSIMKPVSNTVDVSESKLNPFSAAFDPIQMLQAQTKEQLFTELQNILTESQNLKHYIETVIQPNLAQINQVIAQYQSPQGQLLLLSSTPHQLQCNALIQQQIALQQQLISSQLRYQQLQQDMVNKQQLYQQMRDQSYSFVPQSIEQHSTALQSDHDTTPEHEQQNMDNNTDAADTIYTAESVDVDDDDKKHITRSVAETSAASFVPPSVSSEEDHIDEEEEEEEEEEDTPQPEEQEQEEDEQDEQEEPYSEHESMQDEEADESEFESEQQSEITQSTTSATYVLHLHHDVDEDEVEEDNHDDVDNDDYDDDEEDEQTEEHTNHKQFETEFSAEPASVSDSQRLARVLCDHYVRRMSTEHSMLSITPPCIFDLVCRYYAENQIHYKVRQLLDCQSQHLSIDWTEHKDIPLELRFVSRGIDNEAFMSNVMAMFARRSEDPWIRPSHCVKQQTDKKEMLTRKLRGILNKMTPEKFDKVAADTMKIVNLFAETKEKLNSIIGIILSFAILIPVFSDQYAKLCQHLFAHLPRIGMVCEFQWILDDPDLSKTFRKMIIIHTHKLFETYRKYQDDETNKDEQEDPEEVEIRRKKKKNNFFAVLELVAELFNVDLITETVVYKGVLDTLLPPGNKHLTAVDIEGLCRLFKRCGKKLDANHRKVLSGYLQKLIKYAKTFDFRTRVIAEDVEEMRANDWTQRIKKQKAMTIAEVKEQFDEQQQSKNNNTSRKPSYHHHHTHHHRPHSSSYYDVAEDESYNIGYNDAANQSFVSSTSNRGRYNNRGAPHRGHRRYRRAAYNEEDTMSVHSRASSVHSHHSSHRSNHELLRVSSKKRLTENEYDNGESSEQIEWTLNGYIDEYMASGVIDDILDYNCTDLRIWRKVIHTSLRDRKSSEIDYFIELISTLFKHKQLNNKGGAFMHIVVKYLAKQLDDACIDCPNMARYVCRLFARLCYDKHFSVGLLYGTFTKRYCELSQYQSKGQRKQINKMLKYSQDELFNLGASQLVISKLDKYYL